MNTFAEHPPFTILITFILLIVLLFVSNHQLKRTNAVEWMMVIVCFIHSYCFWNLCIHSPHTHQLPFIRSIDVHHPFIQRNSFNGLWCSVSVGDVGRVSGGVQDAMEPNEVWWGGVSDEVVCECGAASDAFEIVWNQMRCGGVV